MSGHGKHQALGGPVWTPAFKVLTWIFGISVVLWVWRFAAGLGATTGLTDAYPWGLWIAFDVVTGMALGCGGYAMAFLIYIFNKGQYHPLVRPALLTSALGYSIGALAINVDVGRTPYLYKIPFAWFWWNKHSVLLEVALCVMAYVTVLWIELSPALFEKWEEGSVPFLKRLAEIFDPVFKKLNVVILALGMLLPTMHQSSLGALMVIGAQKVHGLYQTPWMPFLFLVSCISMGYAVVVFESILAAVSFRRPFETKLLSSIGKVNGWLILFYVALRSGDLIYRGKFGLAFQFSLPMVMFWFETVLFLAGAVMLLLPGYANRISGQFNAAMAIIFAGIIYRLDTYLVAYNPGAGQHYFPTVPELFITIGLIALEIMAYLYFVKVFPIFATAEAPASPRVRGER
jgi:Ni/Fe-hydrogenase subunit HybB-like protein